MTEEKEKKAASNNPKTSSKKPPAKKEAASKVKPKKASTKTKPEKSQNSKESPKESEKKEPTLDAKTGKTVETKAKSKAADDTATKDAKAQKEKAKAEEKNKILETLNLSNETLTLKVDLRKNCKVEFLATVNDPIYAEAEKKALKSIKKEISIPGFRKGKAPESLIRTQYENALKERSEKELVDVAFFQCLKLSTYTPFDPKKSKFLGYSDDKKSLRFEIEAYPKIGDLDFSSWTLPKSEKKQSTDKDYKEAIDKLQNMYAEQKDVTDRGAKEGDFVLVDVMDMDSEKKEKVFSNTRFEMAKGKISDWMREAIIGKNPNETIDTVSKPDVDASEDEKKEFKTKKVSIKINQIQEAKLPELDDDFAKKYKLNSIKDLEDAVKKALENKFEKQWRKEMREEIGKKLKVTDFEVPASLLEQESNYRITQKLKDPKFKAEWSKMNDEKKDAAKDDVVNDAKESLVLMFVTQKIIAEQKLKIHESATPKDPDPLTMAIDFDPMMFFKPNTPEQKNMDYSMRTIQTAEDFIISKLQGKE